MISVVIPIFRSGELLGEAIESVLNQTEKDWELILVDNNASDETLRVAEKYQKNHRDRIRLIHEPIQGVSYARNLGIQEAYGNFIALLDDDDIMYPARLEDQKTLLKNRPEVSIVYGSYDRVSFDNTTVLEEKVIDHPFPHFLNLPPILKESLRLDQVDAMPSTIFFEKHRANLSGLFDPHFSPCFLEDTDFNVRMHLLGDFARSDAQVIRFRTPSPHFLQKKRKGMLFLYRQLQNQDYFFSKIVRKIEQAGLIENSDVRRVLIVWKSRWLKEASFHLLGLTGGVHLARLFLLRAIQESPTNYGAYKHLFRSMMSKEKRVLRYGNSHLTDTNLPLELNSSFVSDLFSGKHKCEFCTLGIN